MDLPAGAAQSSKALSGAWQGSTHPCEDRPVWLVSGVACTVPDLHLDALVLHSPLDLLYSVKCCSAERVSEQILMERGNVGRLRASKTTRLRCSEAELSLTTLSTEPKRRMHFPRVPFSAFQEEVR